MITNKWKIDIMLESRNFLEDHFLRCSRILPIWSYKNDWSSRSWVNQNSLKDNFQILKGLFTAIQLRPNRQVYRSYLTNHFSTTFYSDNNERSNSFRTVHFCESIYSSCEWHFSDLYIFRIIILNWTYFWYFHPSEFSNWINDFKQTKKIMTCVHVLKTKLYADLIFGFSDSQLVFVFVYLYHLVYKIFSTIISCPNLPETLGSNTDFYIRIQSVNCGFKIRSSWMAGRYNYFAT